MVASARPTSSGKIASSHESPHNNNNNGGNDNNNDVPSMVEFLGLNEYACGSAPPAIARGAAEAEQMANSVLSFIKNGAQNINWAGAGQQVIETVKSAEGSLFSNDSKNDVDAREIDIENIEVDEERYSRQLYVHGHETQRKLQSSHVVIVGLSGLGTEIAKNILLAGVATVTLCDPEPPNSFDLGGNFYLSERDIGNTLGRAAISAPQLAELNPNSTVHVARVHDVNNESELMSLVEADITSCLVITLPLPMSTVLALNDLCRARHVPFIYSQIASTFGHVFCDFGNHFAVYDIDGEEPQTSQIEEILPSNPATVNVDARVGGHGLETGDWVKLERVKGKDGSIIKSTQEYEVEVTNAYSFKLLGCDLSNCEEAATQGYVKQVKRPTTVSFWPLRKALRRPEEYELTDHAKYDRPPLLHLAFRALAAYRDRHGNQSPKPGHLDEIKEVVGLAHALDRDSVMLRIPEAERIVMQLASGSQAVLAPMSAIFGGIVGQEVLKACSGTFMPIKGFLFFDAEECLPRQILEQSQLRPTYQSRSDSQRACFGGKAQTAIEALRYLLVGAGAIGCELLKNFALMGLGTSQEGCVFITDPDRVEKSNLCRQLLFRDHDVGQFKSVMAAGAARDINPAMTITVYNEKIGRESEADFTDVFYSNLNGICTALDNVEGRRYLDQKCLVYGIPMFDGGTLGTKGSTQVIVPRLTENYSAARDPDEQETPMCTIKNFPNQIDHTLQWAKEFFAQAFDSDIRNAKSYLFDPDSYMEKLETQQNTKLEKLKSLRKTLVDERPYTFTDCLVWARLRFEEMFNNQIQQLLYNFPPDHVNDFGALFWCGSRRLPAPLHFDAGVICDDAEMRNHYGFIVSAAKLRADVYGLPSNTDENFVMSVLENVIIPPFEPKEGVAVATESKSSFEVDSSESYGYGISDQEEYEDALHSIPRRHQVIDIKLCPIPFDRDNDLHMGFLTNCSNLRAINYDIPTQTLHESRAIAGRIIPAISTTTALVGGLMCLELYKVSGMAQRKMRNQDLKNSFVNIALPFMTMSEPIQPTKRRIFIKGQKRDVSDWDLIDLRLKNANLKQMLKHFKKHLGFVVISITSGHATIYNKYMPSLNGHERPQRLKLPVIQLYLNATKKDFLPKGMHFLQLEVNGFDASTGKEVDLPKLRFYFR